MMYHSTKFLKSMLVKNGARQVSLAAQRVTLVPCQQQGYFMVTQQQESKKQ